MATLLAFLQIQFEIIILLQDFLSILVPFKKNIIISIFFSKTCEIEAPVFGKGVSLGPQTSPDASTEKLLSVSTWQRSYN